MSSKDTFFITTAIDYVNGKPHCGHAYEKVLADSIARYQRLIGRKVFYLTGVDQHGQKIQIEATNSGISAGEYVKDLTQSFKDLCEKLDISYDSWAQTIDDNHKKVVQSILQDLFDKDLIYKKKYKGFYSVRQEQFITEKDRNPDGSFSEEWGEVKEIDEENYFFKLTKFIPWLREFLTEYQYIIPKSRQVDISKALENYDSGDLCISRPKERLNWGIELPFDRDYVTYVWFDALINYISFAGYLDDDCVFKKRWPCDLHVIGKDILRPPHGIYWPIMLKSLGFEDKNMPKVLVHGWWNFKNSDGDVEKMSKSLGNVIDPFLLADDLGADNLRYYLLRDIATTYDSNFDLIRMRDLVNSELANNVGNLLNRSINMTVRYLDGKLSNFNDYDDELCQEIKEKLALCYKEYNENFTNYKINNAIESIIKFSSSCNQFAEKQSPWTLAKEMDKPDVKMKLNTILYYLCESSSHIAHFLLPIVPSSAKKILEQLNIIEYKSIENSTFELKWGILANGHTLKKPKPIFRKID